MKKVFLVFVILVSFFAVECYAGWVKIGGPAGEVFVGQYGIFATNPTNGDIYRYNGAPMNWTKVGGPGYTFAANNTTLYGLSPDKSGVWKYTGSGVTWTKVGGPARMIYAGGNVLCATNTTTGDVYQFL